MMDKYCACVPLDRYEELINLETRVNVVVDRVMRHRYIDSVDLLLTLDTELAVEIAEKIKMEDEEMCGGI